MGAHFISLLFIVSTDVLGLPCWEKTTCDARRFPLEDSRAANYSECSTLAPMACPLLCFLFLTWCIYPSKPSISATGIFLSIYLNCNLFLWPPCRLLPVCPSPHLCFNPQLPLIPTDCLLPGLKYQILNNVSKEQTPKQSGCIQITKLLHVHNSTVLVS